VSFPNLILIQQPGGDCVPAFVSFYSRSWGADLLHCDVYDSPPGP